jgi:hypothetical protein
MPAVITSFGREEVASLCECSSLGTQFPRYDPSSQVDERFHVHTAFGLSPLLKHPG